MSNDLIIQRLTAASALLAEASTPMAIKRIVDVAEAAEVYAKRQQLGDEAIGYAHAIKIDALTKLGEVLKSMPKNTGAAGIGTSAVPPANRTQTPTLADIGIDKKTSMVAQQLASLPAEVRAAIANREATVKEAVSAARKDEVRAERIQKLFEISENNAPIESVARRYPVIYLDPPWRYDYASSDSRAIENQYPTMTLDEIKALDIDSVAMDDCVMFMWATSPKLAEALEVIGAWQFTYRTCAVWDKQKIGMGYYFRQQHELLLVATRGSVPTPRPSDRVGSVISFPRGAHSAKPHEFYELIDAMYPELPKVELFSRTPREGWGAWGNQANVVESCA